MKPKQSKIPVKIVLADDDMDDYSFFKEALNGFSLPTHLTTVRDGEQLMELLTGETYELPDVIFLDLNMPRKNGFECLSEIKFNKILRQLPIIIYSTSFHQKIADLLYKNGANYYISKPSEISSLKKAVQQTITLIAQKEISQPALENFVITEERKNSKTLFWFNSFFRIPFTESFN